MAGAARRTGELMASGYLQTPEGAHVYYIYQGTDRNLPTLVFLNGLSDDTESWKSFLEMFSKPYNILRVDLIGQGKALLKDLEKKVQRPYAITVDRQAEALNFVTEHLNLKKPFDLVGFSYGGGVALEFLNLYPEKIKRLFLWLPYIIRLDQAHPLQRMWGRHFNTLKTLSGPAALGFQIIEKVYGNFLHHYMHHRYQHRIPDSALREVAVQLSEGIMQYNAFEVLERLTPKPVHLITVERDTLVPSSLYHEFWRRLPKNLKKSWLRIEDGEHLILEQAPLYLARWLEHLLSEPVNAQARVFKGQAHAMEWLDETGNSLQI